MTRPYWVVALAGIFTRYLTNNGQHDDWTKSTVDRHRFTDRHDAYAERDYWRQRMGEGLAHKIYVVRVYPKQPGEPS